MAKANQAVAPAQSAVVVETINGQSAEAAQASIHDIGFGTQRAERAIQSGTSERDLLDNNLLHWVVQADEHGRLLKDEATKKYVPIAYTQFIQVRDWYVAAAFDAGAETTDAAAKVWERAVNRLVALDFVRPKAESKDAKRMSEAKEKRAAELAAIPDDEIENLRAALISKGDDKSLKQAVALGQEIKRREKPEIDARAAGLKALRDKVIERAKDLCKAGTADAEDKLIAALNALS